MTRKQTPSPDQLGLSAADLGIEPSDAEKRAEIGRKAIEGIASGVVTDFPSARIAHMPDERRSAVLQETTGLSPLGGDIEGGLEDAPEAGPGVPLKDIQRAEDIKDRQQGRHNARNPKPIRSGRAGTLVDVAQVKARDEAARRERDRNG